MVEMKDDHDMLMESGSDSFSSRFRCTKFELSFEQIWSGEAAGVDGRMIVR
jgi:hypothetical protein